MVKNIVIVNDFANTDGGAGKVAVDVALELSKQYNVFFFTSVKPIDVRFVNSHVRINSSLKIQYIAKQPCAASTRDL